ncbi:MAG: hypothetical protein QOE02_114, partial [Rhodospirillaceae bacterium]|nr:hypothetical protein [Rhodospirillaceae bacterium]
RRITDEVIAPALAGKLAPRAAADAVTAIAVSPAMLRHAAESPPRAYRRMG